MNTSVGHGWPEHVGTLVVLTHEPGRGPQPGHGPPPAGGGVGVCGNVRVCECVHAVWPQQRLRQLLPAVAEQQDRWLGRPTAHDPAPALLLVAQLPAVPGTGAQQRWHTICLQPVVAGWLPVLCVV